MTHERMLVMYREISPFVKLGTPLRSPERDGTGMIADLGACRRSRVSQTSGPGIAGYHCRPTRIIGLYVLKGMPRAIPDDLETSRVICRRPMSEDPELFFGHIMHHFLFPKPVRVVQRGRGKTFSFLSIVVASLIITGDAHGTGPGLGPVP
jgi:hypothetical protein